MTAAITLTARPGAAGTAPRPARITGLLLCVSCLALLSACKGGGGSGVAGTPVGGPIAGYNYASPIAPPAPVSPSVFQTSFVTSFSPTVVAQVNTLLASAKYQLQNSRWRNVDTTGAPVGPTYSSFPLANSGVVYAHALGLTGAGATVAVVDTHLNGIHEVFSGKTIAFSDVQTPASASLDHGTMVSSIIAGNSSTFTGVAPGANLIFGSFTSDQTITAATNAAALAGAVAQNNSWGFDTLDINGSSFNAVFGNASGQTYLAALHNYVSQGPRPGVVVFAVSNDTTKTHATIMDALPYVETGLEAGWIAVANATPTMNANGNVSSVVMQSSSCLEAARWCILADGAWTAALSSSNTGYGFGVGSSFAAPQVSGSLALLAEAFPSLTPQQLRVRLLASADNHFFTPDATVELATGFNKGYSYQYGVGFLDVAAALLPIGASQMSLPGGAVQNIDQPILMSGSAFGDAVSHSLAGVDVAFSDSLNAGFTKSAAALATSAAPPPLAARLLTSAVAADLAGQRTSAQVGLSDPFAGFSGQSYTLRDPSGDMKASVLMPTGAGESYGVSLTKAVTDGPARLELGLKLAHDQGSVMGFGGTGGNAGADMVSLQLGLSQTLGKNGFLTMGGEVGIASLGQQAALTRVSSAGFNSVNLGIGRREVFADDDKLAFGVSMPVAVSSGSAQLVLPVAGALAKGSFNAVNLDLAPSDRQVDMSISYQRRLGEGVEMLFELVHAENFGNRAGETDNAGVLSVKYAF